MSRKIEARGRVAEWVTPRAGQNWRCFVRINPLAGNLALDDLAAVVRPGLHGVLLPKVDSAQDVIRLGHYLDALEIAAGLPRGSVGIAVVATETPKAMLALGSYTTVALPRLIAMTWGAENLAAAIGALDNKQPDGGWTAPYQIARAQCLFAAAAANVPAIDTLYADFRDLEGLAADCARGRRDGFSWRIAIHPDQVAPINVGFMPSPQELVTARRVVRAFAAAGVNDAD